MTVRIIRDFKFKLYFPRTIVVILIISLCLILISCGTRADISNMTSAADISDMTDTASDAADDINNNHFFTFTDALGRSVTVGYNPASAVSLHGSYAEAWSLAGGTLVGVTRDVIDEDRQVSGDNIIMVGTNRDPNLEEILSLDPDFIILSADMESQLKLDNIFTDAGIPHAYFSVDTWEDYISQMEIFCEITGRPDLYQQNAASVGEEIQEIIKAVPETDNPPVVLLIRAYSTGLKVRGADNQTGMILKDLGADNLADRDESLLEDLSLEIIMQEDPDFIFVTTMGDENAAYEYLENGLFQNPAWNSLTAARNGHVIPLPKDLFHYKPNNRWSESYAYLSEILYGS